MKERIYRQMKKVFSCLLCAVLLAGSGTAVSASSFSVSSSDTDSANTSPDSEGAFYTDVSRAETEEDTRTLAKANRTAEEGDADLAVVGDDLPLNKKKYTLMVYMTGSNLESQFGAASADLDEMREADVDYSAVNVVVCAGGSRMWRSRIPSDKNSVLDLSKDDEHWIVAQTAGSADMGGPATFESFVNFAVSHYPAEHYALILWDHGGGPLYGYGSDELYGGDSLTLPEMKTAMDDTVFSKDRKLDFIGFDACLMGNLETACVWKNYARYMIGSEELENGAGWDYRFLEHLGETEDTRTLAAEILKDYGDYYEEHTSAFSHPDATLSFFDLDKTDHLVDALDDLCARMGQDIEEGDYYDISRARNASKAFGLSASSDRGSGYDLIDLADFADHLSGEYTSEKAALNTALMEFVAAQNSNVENTGGVSFYFPGDNLPLYSDKSDDYYSGAVVSEAYAGFLAKYAGRWTDAADTDWTLAAPQKDGEEYTLQLTEDQIENAARISYTVLMKMPYGGYIVSAAYRQLTPDENGIVHIPPDPQLLTVMTGGRREDIPLMFRQISASDKEEQYQSVGLWLTAGEEFESFDPSSDEAVKVNLSVNPADGSVTVRSVESDTDEEAEAGKSEVDVSHYKSLSLVYGTSLNPSYYEDGKARPFLEWNSGNTGGEYSFPFDGDFEFVTSHTSDYDADFIIQLCIRDINGQVHGSDVTELEKKAAEPVTEQITTESGTLTFSLSGGEAELTSYEGSGTSVVIPETVAGRTVTRIGDSAFYGASSELTSITLPDTLKEIRPYAFSSCISLKDVNIPDSVSCIGRGAFSGCSEMERLTIPSSLETLEEGAFIGMSSLEEFAQDSENGATAVKDGVLFSKDGKTLLSYPGDGETAYDVPEGTEEIGYGAFADSGIEKISFPESLRRISNYAFYDCSDLSVLVLPQSLEEIGEKAFGSYWRFSTAEVETISIGKNVRYIGSKAFLCIDNERFEVDPDNPRYSSPGGYLANKEGDMLLMAPLAGRQEAVVPEGVVTLQDDLFSEYNTDAEFTLPDSLTRIPDEVFPCSYGSEKDEDGNSIRVYSIRIHCGEGSYAEEYALEHDISYDYDTDTFVQETVKTDKGECTYKVYSDHAVLTKYKGEGEELVIPEKADGKPVTEVGDGENSLADDGESSFSSWNETITKVVLPDSVTKIADKAMQNMSALKTCRIPASVREIGPGAFAGTGIEEFDVDGGNMAYRVLDGMLYSADKKTLVSYPAGGTVDGRTLEIPDGTEVIADYSFYGVGLFASSLRLPDTIREIGKEAFHMCRFFEEINFPEGLTSIGREAFKQTDIEEAILPDSLEELGSGAFEFCDSLKKVQIPGRLERIPEYAFGNCGHLSDMTIGEGVREIGQSAFSGCEALKEIVIPDSVTDVGGDAFGVWGEEKTVPTGRVYIGKRVQTISSREFRGRTFDAYEVNEKSKNLKAEGALLLSADGTKLLSCAFGGGDTVRIPETVTEIEAYAFELDTGLTDVYIPDSVRNIDSSAFFGVEAADAASDAEDRTGQLLRVHCSASSVAKIYADSCGFETVTE